MRKFLKTFLRSLGTFLGLAGGITRPSFMVGFPRLVILITYGMRNFTMEAVSLVCILATNLTSGTMCCDCILPFLQCLLCAFVPLQAIDPFADSPNRPPSSQCSVGLITFEASALCRVIMRLITARVINRRQNVGTIFLSFFARKLFFNRIFPRV